MRLTEAARVGHALAIATVPAMFGGLCALGMGTALGVAGVVFGVALTALASGGSAFWTYRAVRKFRTIAQSPNNQAPGRAPRHPASSR